ncbi:hypothetical protein [Anaerovorax odorimutans]|uniref:hypothetical protein n=1 Tax=Anaerovorax odorimutans TaxID=109327 RepID=UPI0012EC7634|nr:hypothetical protein [Anaerovorax odorimutans]
MKNSKFIKKLVSQVIIVLCMLIGLSYISFAENLNGALSIYNNYAECQSVTNINVLNMFSLQGSIVAFIILLICLAANRKINE